MSILRELARTLNGTKIDKVPVSAKPKTWGSVEYISVEFGINKTDVRIIGNYVHWGVEGVFTTPVPSSNYQSHQIDAVAEVILDNVERWTDPRPACASWTGNPTGGGVGQYVTMTLSGSP